MHIGRDYKREPGEIQRVSGFFARLAIKCYPRKTKALVFIIYLSLIPHFLFSSIE
jgi:hypothetical protein